MTSAANQAPGFYSFHANRLEDLRAIVVKMCAADPLPPLHNDMCLVQSNGIAQWLKLGLAQSPEEGGLGIAAGMDFSLPSTFIWRAYRAFLSSEEVPDQSPLDKDTLIWRIYRLLDKLSVGKLSEDRDYDALRKFLAGDNPELRRYQLAERLAMLYDQYQMYRADWLADWEVNKDQLIINGTGRALEAEHAWQAKFWRLILEDVGEALASTSRATVHSTFMHSAAKSSHALNPALLPKRIFVFGISALPKQILEALQLVSKFTQVVFCVANPCQYYWGDIVSQRDLISAIKHKSRAKPHQFFDNVALDEMHNHANPILASLGKQGRDYIRLLEEFDGGQIDSLSKTPTQRQDVFYPYGDESQGTPLSLLHQIQNDIFHLTPIGELLNEQRAYQAGAERSLMFHEVHSEQRELEVLHDQLLYAFNEDSELLPSDILVMTPDINKYAPHINAVFGLHEQYDNRYIPFTISDQGLRHLDPHIIAFENLLSLKLSRFTYSDVISLLELPAISEKFGLEIQDLDTLKKWVQGANVRWGLDASHRKQLVPMQNLPINTWQSGLRAMLLGYSMGTGGEWATNVAFDEVGGLEARLIGNLSEFIDALRHLKTICEQEHSAAQWQVIIRELIDTFFADSDINTMAIKAEIARQAEKLVNNVRLADAQAQNLPVATVKELILESLDAGTLNHRFLMGKVNFATLMPMRAIPFKRVYLLGMSDAAFPRSNKPVDFDLMANDYRPGDRSLREDDRYLFLEALLAAREAIYISWVGRNISDDSVRPPSVLVSQLSDYINKFWKLSQQSPRDSEHGAGTVTEQLTYVHPLQPFSERYFPSDTKNTAMPSNKVRAWFTYGAEWRQTSLSIRNNAAGKSNAGQLNVNNEAGYSSAIIDFRPRQNALSLSELAQFLKKPLESFFTKGLLINFEEQRELQTDDETFVIDPLHQYSIESMLIEQAILPSHDHQALSSNLHSCLQHLNHSGEIGLASTAIGLEEQLHQDTMALGERFLQHVQSLRPLSEYRIDIQHTLKLDTHDELVLEDSISGFWQSQTAKNEYFIRVMIAQSKTSKEINNKPQRRFESLIPYWLEHLAGHLCATPFTTEVLAKERNCFYRFEPTTKEQAQSMLRDIINTWQQGLSRPLNIDSKAGCTLANGMINDESSKAFDAALTSMKATLEYDKGYFTRAFGRNIDPQVFITSPSFIALSELLYSPMIKAIHIVEGEQ